MSVEGVYDSVLLKTKSRQSQMWNARDTVIIYLYMSPVPIKFSSLFLHRKFLKAITNYVCDHKFVWTQNRNWKQNMEVILYICSSEAKFDFIALHSLTTTFLCAFKETSLLQFIKSRHTGAIFKYMLAWFDILLISKNKRALDKKEKVVCHRDLFLFLFLLFQKRAFNLLLMKCIEAVYKVSYTNNKFVLKCIIICRTVSDNRNLL